MTGTNLLLAMLLAGTAAYAQHRIGFHTAGPRATLNTRVALATIGVALGYALAGHAGGEAGWLLAFVQGFGLAHAPAALCLCLRRQAPPRLR